jgi:two-component system NtrC family response regulator
METLKSYEWPGNVRELVATLESALSSAQNEPTLYPVHLPVWIRIQQARDSLDDAPRSLEPENLGKPGPKSLPPLQDVVDVTEKQYFDELISFTKGNLNEICRISGLSRSSLYAHLKKHNITRHF